MPTIQGICTIEGCKKLQERIRTRGIKTYFRNICRKHRLIKYDMVDNSKEHIKKWFQRHPNYFFHPTKYILDIDTSKCSICGWDKANCDIHRIKKGKDGGKYEKENVIVVCPNCHRLLERGIIKL